MNLLLLAASQAFDNQLIVSVILHLNYKKKKKERNYLLVAACEKDFAPWAFSFKFAFHVANT